MRIIYVFLALVSIRYFFAKYFFVEFFRLIRGYFPYTEGRGLFSRNLLVIHVYYNVIDSVGLRDFFGGVGVG